MAQRQQQQIPRQLGQSTQPQINQSQRSTNAQHRLVNVATTMAINGSQSQHVYAVLSSQPQQTTHQVRRPQQQQQYIEFPSSG